ncbi:MAG: nucleoside hydrolase [Gammaproteobacteria bacterium]
MTHCSLIYDCDPGVDDAIALFLAFASPAELDLIGITTVGGNVPGALTARNACLIREWAAREDVPVHAGCEGPIVLNAVDAEHFHGATGLGHLPVHTPHQGPAPGHAANFIVEQLRTRPAGTVTLAVTGPLTNVAMALRLAPDIAPRIARIALMGGARSAGGNITASAEYNIHADPHAADIVFRSGVPLHVFGLDVTHQVRSSSARREAIRALGTPNALRVAKLLAFADGLPANQERGFGTALHDPCIIAWLLRPALFSFQDCHLVVSTDAGLTRGHTAVEFRTSAHVPVNAHWGVAADAEGVFALLLEKLR